MTVTYCYRIINPIMLFFRYFSFRWLDFFLNAEGLFIMIMLIAILILIFPIFSDKKFDRDKCCASCMCKQKMLILFFLTQWISCDWVSSMSLQMIFPNKRASSSSSNRNCSYDHFNASIVRFFFFFKIFILSNHKSSGMSLSIDAKHSCLLIMICLWQYLKRASNESSWFLLSFSLCV